MSMMKLLSWLVLLILLHSKSCDSYLQTNSLRSFLARGNSFRGLLKIGNVEIQSLHGPIFVQESGHMINKLAHKERKKSKGSLRRARRKEIQAGALRRAHPWQKEIKVDCVDNADELREEGNCPECPVMTAQPREMKEGCRGNCFWKTDVPTQNKCVEREINWCFEVKTKDHYDAGTDDNVHIVFYFSDQSECTTGGLDQRGVNDFTRNSLRTYCDADGLYSGTCKGKLLHKATSARMKVVKRWGMAWCDEVCVDFVRVFTKPMGNYADNTNPGHGFYGKEFSVKDGTLTYNGCDDCDH